MAVPTPLLAALARIAPLVASGCLLAVALPFAGCDDASSSSSPRPPNRCEGPEVTAAGLAASDTPCLEDDACSALPGTRCFAPDQLPACTSPGVGGAAPPTCLTDDDCADKPEGAICQPRDELGVRWCQPACDNDAKCGVAQRCEADGHCVDRVCGAAADGKEACPSGSFCTAAGTCAYQHCNAERPCTQEGEICDPTSFVCVPTPCVAAADGFSADCPALFRCVAPLGTADEQAPKTCQRATCACAAGCGSAGLCVQGRCFAKAGRCLSPTACGG